MSSNFSDVTKMQEELQWIYKSDKEAHSFLGKAKEKSTSNLLVPIGCIATVAVLVNGFRHLYRRDSVKQQKMMRWRVVAQGLTILVTTFSLAAAGKLKYK